MELDKFFELFKKLSDMNKLMMVVMDVEVGKIDSFNEYDWGYKIKSGERVINLPQ